MNSFGNVGPARFEHHVVAHVGEDFRVRVVGTRGGAQRTILLRHFIVGFCIEEQELTELRAGGDRARREELKTPADPARTPTTASRWA